MASIEVRIFTDKLDSSFASFSRNLFILCCNSTILLERSASCCNAVYYPIKSIDSCFSLMLFAHRTRSFWRTRGYWGYCRAHGSENWRLVKEQSLVRALVH